MTLRRVVFDMSTLISVAMDNQFLALAFECESNALVSSDVDLLVLHADPWPFRSEG